MQRAQKYQYNKNISSKIFMMMDSEREFFFGREFQKEMEEGKKELEKEVVLVQGS